jgi:hypothetical protein
MRLSTKKNTVDFQLYIKLLVRELGETKGEVRAQWQEQNERPRRLTAPSDVMCN